MYGVMKPLFLLFVAALVTLNRAEPPPEWAPYSTIRTTNTNNQVWQTLPPREVANSQTLPDSTPYYQQYQQQSIPTSPPLVPYSETPSVATQPELAQPAQSAPATEPQIVVPSPQFFPSENIFQARAPANISLGGQQSFFYSPKENALYQVMRIQLAQVPAFANVLEPQIPFAPPTTSSAQPSQNYGVPVQYGPPPTTTTTPAPSTPPTRIVYKYRTRPKINFTIEIDDFNNDCYEEIQPEEVGENRHPKLTPQRIKSYRRKRGSDAAGCNGPIRDPPAYRNPLAPFPSYENVPSQPAVPLTNGIQGGDSYLPQQQAPATAAAPHNVYSVPTNEYSAQTTSYAAPSTTYGPPNNAFFDEFEAAGPANSARQRRPGGSRVKLGIESEIGR